MYDKERMDTMKKLVCCAVVMLCVIVCAGVSFAGESDKSDQCHKGHEMMKCGMMPCGMMGMGHMAGKMMKKDMIATNDGGVVVMIGKRLLKYDKNLKLVKEVEIAMPRMDTCCPMVHGKNCPCCMTKKDRGEKESMKEKSVTQQ